MTATRTKEWLWRGFLVGAALVLAWLARGADWGVVWRSAPLLLRGLGNSLLLTVLSVGIGIAAGTVLAFLRLYAPAGLRHAATGFIEGVRAIPQLMVIFWVFYTWPAMTGTSIPGWSAAIIALSMIASAYTAEIVRAGIQSVAVVQWESAHASGLTKLQAMRTIVLPQALHTMVPALVSQAIMMFKTTSLVYVVGVIDFFRAVIIVNNRDFAPGALYMTMAIGYFVCCYALSAIVRRLEPRYVLTD